MNAGDRDRKAAWAAEQRQLAQASFPISSELLQSLFDFVEAEVSSNGCDHTLRFTIRWTTDRHPPERELIDWLRQHGGFCDCEVGSNAFDHWQRNR